MFYVSVCVCLLFFSKLVRTKWPRQLKRGGKGGKVSQTERSLRRERVDVIAAVLEIEGGGADHVIKGADHVTEGDEAETEGGGVDHERGNDQGTRNIAADQGNEVSLKRENAVDPEIPNEGEGVDLVREAEETGRGAGQGRGLIVTDIAADQRVRKGKKIIKIWRQMVVYRQLLLLVIIMVKKLLRQMELRPHPSNVKSLTCTYYIHYFPNKIFPQTKN